MYSLLPQQHEPGFKFLIARYSIVWTPTVSVINKMFIFTAQICSVKQIDLAQLRISCGLDAKATGYVKQILFRHRCHPIPPQQSYITSGQWATENIVRILNASRRRANFECQIISIEIEFRIFWSSIPFHITLELNTKIWNEVILEVLLSNVAQTYSTTYCSTGGWKSRILYTATGRPNVSSSLVCLATRGKRN